jgi:hypothetical protein
MTIDGGSPHDPYGGRTRQQYLDDLAKEYDVTRAFVLELASMLGPNEDFDGLVTELEDYVELREEGSEDGYEDGYDEDEDEE